MSKTDNAPPPSQITSFCGVIEVTFTAKDNCNNMSTLVKTYCSFFRLQAIARSDFVNEELVHKSLPYNFAAIASPISRVLFEPPIS